MNLTFQSTNENDLQADLFHKKNLFLFLDIVKEGMRRVDIKDHRVS